MQREQLAGKLALAEKEYKELEMLSQSALTMIIMKTDPYTEITQLDTELIAANAKNLHENAERMRTIAKTIHVLKRELGQ